MPTFRNDTDKFIVYKLDKEKKYVMFDPKKEVPLEFWVPYVQLGLTLVSASYPPVPDTILISGEFLFDNGLVRKFNIDPCDTYYLEVVVKSGKILIFPGESKNNIPVSANEKHSVKFEWAKYPYIRVVGVHADTVALILAYRGDDR